MGGHSPALTNLTRSDDRIPGESESLKLSIKKDIGAITYFLFNLILCVWVFLLPAYLCATFMPGFEGIQKREMDLQELE